jgi:hypothetical protein
MAALVTPFVSLVSLSSLLSFPKEATIVVGRCARIAGDVLPHYGTDWKNSQISFAAWISRLELPSRCGPCMAGCGAPWPPPLMV